MWKQLALNIDDETFQFARIWREYALSEKMLTRSRVMCFDANGLLVLDCTHTYKLKISVTNFGE